MKTKHATVMFTDIKGFTSRTSKSSREQLHRQLELHEELVEPIFEKFNGEVVKTIGDAYMVVFESPTDAVLCGMKIQKVLDKHNELSLEEDQFEVRVAINSGEVTVKKKDVFGEAVNIASRLESVAEAGSIYFTEAVYLSMNKNEIPTTEVGFRRFKGVPEQVKVYKVLQEGKRKGLLRKKEKPVKRFRESKKMKILKWVLIVIIIFIFLKSCSG